jgi:hypothetical protein
MLKHASWINGNAVVVEEPNNILVRHWGWGTEMQFTFAPGVVPRGTWCHIVLPAPVIVNDVRMKVQKLFLFFQDRAARDDRQHPCL